MNSKAATVIKVTLYGILGVIIVIIALIGLLVAAVDLDDTAASEPKVTTSTKATATPKATPKATATAPATRKDTRDLDEVHTQCRIFMGVYATWKDFDGSYSQQKSMNTGLSAMESADGRDTVIDGAIASIFKNQNVDENLEIIAGRCSRIAQTHDWPGITY